MMYFGEKPAKNKERNNKEGGHVLDKVEEERKQATDQKSLVKAVIFVPITVAWPRS